MKAICSLLIGSALLWPGLAAAGPTDWQLVAGADADGAWVAVDGHWPDFDALDERELTCRWTVQLGDTGHWVWDDAQVIPEEGVCVLDTARDLPDLSFPPTTPLTVSLALLGASGEALVTVGPRSLSWDRATLVSTRAIRAGLEAAGWTYRLAEQVPSWGEGHRWFAVSLSRDDVWCALEVQVGQLTDRPLPEGIPPDAVAHGANHWIYVIQCDETRAGRTQSWERTARDDLQAELVTLLTRLVHPPTSAVPAPPPGRTEGIPVGGHPPK